MSLRFSMLSTKDDDHTDPSLKKIIMPRPPPIFVQNVEFIANLTNVLNNIHDCNYQLKILCNNQVKN